MRQTTALKTVFVLILVQVFMHAYDWILHVEDVWWFPVDFPWQAPHSRSAGLQLFGYTEWWSMYWGFALILSIICTVLLSYYFYVEARR